MHRTGLFGSTTQTSSVFFGFFFFLKKSNRGDTNREWIQLYTLCCHGGGGALTFCFQHQGARLPYSNCKQRIS